MRGFTANLSCQRESQLGISSRMHTLPLTFMTGLSGVARSQSPAPRSPLPLLGSLLSYGGQNHGLKSCDGSNNTQKKLSIQTTLIWHSGKGSSRFNQKQSINIPGPTVTRQGLRCPSPAKWVCVTPSSPSESCTVLTEGNFCVTFPLYLHFLSNLSWLDCFQPYPDHPTLTHPSCFTPDETSPSTHTIASNNTCNLH